MQSAEQNQSQDGDQKSGRIVALEGGRKKAIVPRNSFRWLKAVTAQEPIEWEGHKAEGMQAGAVYEVGLTIPNKAFPGMGSAKTLAQSVKASLAATETKSGTTVEPIISILRTGNPSQRTVIRLNVDEFKQSTTNQGIKTLGSARKTTKGRGRPPKKAAAAAAGVRKGNGRKGNGRKKGQQAGAATKRIAPQEVTAQRQGTRKQASIESFLNGLQLRNWSEFKAAEREVEALQKTCPIIYNHLVKGIAA